MFPRNATDNQVPNAASGRGQILTRTNGRPALAASTGTTAVVTHPMEFDIGSSDDPDLMRDDVRENQGKVNLPEEKLARNYMEFQHARQVVHEYQLSTQGQLAASTFFLGITFAFLCSPSSVLTAYMLGFRHITSLMISILRILTYP